MPVTEVDISESAADESLSLLVATADALPAYIAYVDTELHYKFVNEAYARLWPKPKSYFIGRPAKAILGIDSSKLENALNCALVGESEEVEITLDNRDGSTCPIRVEYVPHKSVTDQVIGVLVLAFDISELRADRQNLQESKQRLQSILNSSTDGIISIDKRGRIASFSKSAERLLGYAEDEVIGQNMEILVPDAVRDHHQRYRQKYSENATNRLMGGVDLFARCKNGQELPVEIYLHPAVTEGHQHVIACIRDVSLRAEVKSALQESQERLRLLLESTNAIPWERDVRTWSITYVGPRSVELLGYKGERWLEKDFWADHLHPDDKSWTDEHRRKITAENDNCEFEYRMTAEDGRVVWIHDIVNAISEDGKLIGLRGFMIDITERKRTEKILRDLSARLIAAQEDEQKRIARELHDDLSQELALVAVELDLLEKDLPKNRRTISRRLRRIYEMAKDASSAVHKISHHLHPAMLDQLGLAAAIAEYCNEVSAHQGPLIEFKNLGVSGTISADVSLSFYRVLQESIQNALKHSGADTVCVTFLFRDKKICLTVQDEGCGFRFDPNADCGLGLRSMAERMAIIGGTFDISTEPGKGTLITACRAL